MPNLDGKSFPTVKDIRVTEEGVLKLLLKLSPAQACGPDHSSKNTQGIGTQDCTLPSINFPEVP